MGATPAWRTHGLVKTVSTRSNLYLRDKILEKRLQCTTLTSKQEMRIQDLQSARIRKCVWAAGLGGVWNTDSAQDLRASIRLQHLCLTTTQMPAFFDHSVCEKWKDCLDASSALYTTAGSSYKEQIQTILEASGAQDAPCAPHFSSLCSSSPAPPSSNGDTDTCLNPFVSDPESWDCACHEAIDNLCSGESNYVNCYKGALCGKADVCDSWKTAVSCPGYGLQLLQNSNAHPTNPTDDLLSLLAGQSKSTVGWDCG